MTGRITVKIENAYEDEHQSERVVDLPEPDRDAETGEWLLDDWFQDVVFDETGDGHGISGLGSCYTATVIDAIHAELIGKSNEWVD